MKESEWISLSEEKPLRMSTYKVKSSLWTALADWNEEKQEFENIRKYKGACMFSEITYWDFQ